MENEFVSKSNSRKRRRGPYCQTDSVGDKYDVENSDELLERNGITSFNKRGPYNSESTLFSLEEEPLEKNVFLSSDDDDDDQDEQRDTHENFLEDYSEDFHIDADADDDDEQDGQRDTHEKLQEDYSEGTQNLYEGSRLSVADSILLIITYIMKYNICKEGLKDLLSLIELHCPAINRVKISITDFYNFFRKLKSPFKFQYYCKECFGFYEEKKPTDCSFCKAKDSITFFITISLVSQLRNIIKTDKISSILENRNNKPSKDVITDVKDGELYKKIFDGNFLRGSPKKENEIHISFQLNTDGVAIFNSSKFSVWPIYLTINELPPNERFSRENRMFVGLWFGFSKPIVDLFFKPVVEEVKDLYQKGIEILISGEVKTVKGVILSIVCDSPARSMVQNFSQFNGFHGCGSCTERGTSTMVNKGTTLTYPFNNSEMCNGKGYAKDRTHKETLHQAKIAHTSNKAEMGVKGLSILYLLPTFNIIRGTCIDYMHSVLLGVTKMLISIWFDPKNKKFPYYLGHYLPIINSRILKMTPPYFITRSPRKIDDMAHWKASEFRTFLLFYCVPCLYQILPSNYFNHLLCLNQAIFILLQDSISKNEIITAQNLICKFVAKIEFLYGSKYERSNVHSLLHLPTKVKDLGPLWANSCFFYEDLNGDIRSLFHGTQQIAIQISTAVTIQQQLPILISYLKPGSEAQYLYSKLNSKYSSNNKHMISENTYALGCLHPFSLPNNIPKLPNANSVLRTHKFFKIVKDGRVYHSKGYTRVHVRDSCSVQYIESNGAAYFGSIQYFIKVDYNNASFFYAVIHTLNKLENSNMPQYVFCVQENSSPILINIEQIISHCMIMHVDNSTYVAIMPNVVETDQVH